VSTTSKLAREFTPVEDLSPTAIESFLHSNGWARVNYRPGISAIWENDALDASILMPYNEEFRDFPARLRDALDTICSVHDISNEALPVEIASAQNDIMFLRADQSASDGSIPLQEAQVLLNGVARIMLAAACSAIRPKASNAGRRPAAASEFVAKNVRMGHTRRGSFVMTIFARHEDGTPATSMDVPDLAPETGGGGDARFDDPPEPFTRHVMETLANGLQATQELLAPNSGLTLDEAVERGASAEMVESVGAMANQEGVRALDLSFLWSRSRPLNDGVPERIEVSRPRMDRVEAVVNSLEKRAPVTQNEVVGHVVRLERAEGDDDGTVVVEGFIGRVRRRMRMNLSGEAYRSAIHAHEQRRPVVASGEISLIGRSWWLTDNVTLRLR
jgi:hypothetical protein